MVSTQFGVSFLAKYDNYRVIYIDDASEDDTYNLVKNYINTHSMQGRVTLIKNETNCGAMANWYHAVRMCADDEIIVSLDGDDWFFNEHVLERIAREYENTDTWMTYGSFISYPEGEVGFAQQIPEWVIDQQAYRRFKFVSTHLRTFYAWLFKKIDISDFYYKNKEFLPMVCDQALMFPMLEMAANHAHFISDILYVYNRSNPLSDEKVDLLLSYNCKTVIRKRTVYKKYEQ